MRQPSLTLEQYRDIIENTLEGVWLLDSQGRTLFANQSVTSMLGYSQSELVNTPLLDYVDPSSQNRAEQGLRRSHKGHREEHELRFRRKDGTVLWALFLTSPLYAGDKPTGCINLLIDITERKILEQAVQTSEELYRKIFDFAGVGIIELNMSGLIAWCGEATREATQQLRKRLSNEPSLATQAAEHIQVVRANRAAVDLLEAKREEQLLGPIERLFVADSLPVFNSGLVDFLEGADQLDIELPLRCVSGKTIQALIRLQAPDDRYGTLPVTLLDMTQRKALENALRISEERFRDFAETAADWFWEMGADLRFTYLSGRVYEILGLSPKELLGMTREEAHANQIYTDQEVWLEHLKAIRSHRKEVSVELDWKRPDGELRFIRMRGRARFNESGEFLGYRGVGTDMTGYHQAEIERKREEAFRHAVIENAAEGLCVCYRGSEDSQLEFSLWNQRMTEITGYTQVQINKIGWYQALFRDTAEQVDMTRRMERLFTGDRMQAEEWRITTAEGSDRIISISASTLSTPAARPAVLALIQDVTERRTQQDAILRIAKGISPRSGADALNILLKYLLPAINGSVACIGMLDRTRADPKQIHTMLVVSRRGQEPNYSYMLERSPCARVLENRYCIYSRRVYEHFPNDQQLSSKKIQGYAGAPLVDSSGAVKGILRVLFEKPIANTEYVESILRIFSSRIMSELERQETEESLRAERQRLQDFAEVASDWFWEMGPDLRFTYFSERITESLGIPGESMIGKTREDLLYDVYDKEMWREHLKTIYAHKPFSNFEYKIKLANDKYAHISISGMPLFDHDGQFLGYRGIGQNMTEEIEAKQAERRMQDRLHDAMEAVPGGVLLFDKDDRLVLCNSHYRDAVKEIAHLLVPGTSLEEINRGLATAGLVELDGLTVEGWVRRREELHRLGRPFVLKVKNDRWIEVFEYTTQEQGTLILRMDITERMKAQQALKASEGRYRALIEQAADGLIVTDKVNVVTVSNEAAQHMLGYQEHELVGLDMAQLINPDEWDSYYWQLHRLHRDGALIMQQTLRRKDGTSVPVEISSRTLPDGRVQALIRDITERLLSEERLRLSATVFESTREGVMITDTTGQITAVNSAFTEITGYCEEEVIGLNPNILRSGRHDKMFYQEMWRTIHEEGYWRGEIWNRRKDGSIYPEWETISTVKNDRGELTNYVAVFSDISDVKESENQLEYLAHHDPLTELPNRLLFNARVDHALERAKREHSCMAVMFIDLDLFKHINDSLGHPVGDALLQRVACRIKKQLREEDTVARLGGDEFTILLEHLPDPNKAGDIAGKLIQSFGESFPVDGRDLHVTASIGISIYPGDGDTADALLRNADTAMYQAKERGRDGYQYYTEELTSIAVNRVLLENSLRRALQQNQFVAYYQPKLSLVDGRVIGAEALIRWLNPEMGLVPPDNFIPLAEDTGLILPIGRWMLDTTCRQIKEWQQMGLDTGTVAVNLSAQQLYREDLVTTVQETLERYGLVASCLELEITESFIMDQKERSIEVLGELRKLGVTLSIDDFGTGYSSLSYLKQLPIDTLKIDQSFVRDIPQDPNDEAITRAIISLADNLQLGVIAEGVETEQQADFLLREGCCFGQGYLFSPPVPAQEFELILRADQQRKSQAH